MKRENRNLKMLAYISCVLILLLFTSALTKPTTDDYVQFFESETGVTIPENVKIGEADLFFLTLFATAPKETIDEYGIVHIGFMGHFFKVTDGQFDDSI